MTRAMTDAELLASLAEIQRRLLPRVPTPLRCPHCRLLAVIDDADVTVHYDPRDLCGPCETLHGEVSAEIAYDRMTDMERAYHDHNWGRL